MKKMLSAIAVVSLSLCLSVSAFAAPTVEPVPDGYGFGVEDGVTTLGTFKTSACSQAVKDFLIDWFAIATGEKTTEDTIAFGVFSTSPDYTVIFSRGTGAAQLVGAGFFPYPDKVDSVFFVYQPDGTYTLKGSGEVDSSSGGKNSVLPFKPVIFALGSHAYLENVNAVMDVGSKFAWKDDYGLMGGEDTSSSEPSTSLPSSSVPPYVPTPPPVMGGGTSDYIPYDPDIWWSIVSYIRTGLGSASSIILLILAPIILIPIIHALIKHYAAGGKSTGGGDVI